MRNRYSYFRKRKVQARARQKLRRQNVVEKSRKTPLIFSAFFITECVFLICLCVLLGISHLLGATVFSVVSGSMEPAMPQDSLAIAFPSDTLEADDILLYTSGSQLISHRVSRIDEDGKVWTKGDANENIDVVPVTRDHIQGKVVFYIPGVGKMLGMLQRHKVVGLGVLALLNTAVLCLCYRARTKNVRMKEALA